MDIPIPAINITNIINRYLSIDCTNRKTIYLFEFKDKMMGKKLELVGFALIGGTIYSFLGMGDSEMRWPVFWGCAVGALAIIVYRNMKRKSKMTKGQ